MSEEREYNIKYLTHERSKRILVKDVTLIDSAMIYTTEGNYSKHSYRAHDTQAEAQHYLKNNVF